MEWEVSGTLHHELNRQTTNQLKGLCQCNGILYGGAKYKLVARLVAHAKQGRKQQQQQQAQAKAESGCVQL